MTTPNIRKQAAVVGTSEEEGNVEGADQVVTGRDDHLGEISARLTYLEDNHYDAMTEDMYDQVIGMSDKVTELLSRVSTLECLVCKFDNELFALSKHCIRHDNEGCSLINSLGATPTNGRSAPPEKTSLVNFGHTSTKKPSG